MLALVGLVWSTGCATAPDTVAQPRNLKGDYVIFFEQSDRIPKEVLLAANDDKGMTVNAMTALSPEAIAKLIEELVKVAPEIAKTFSEERMENALLQRRILLRGYSGEELKDVVDIIDALNGSIEFVTPQTKTPAVKATVQPKKK
jgi:hypothetical protein